MNISKQLLLLNIFLFPLVAHSYSAQSTKKINEIYFLENIRGISVNELSNMLYFNDEANIADIEKDYSALLTKEQLIIFNLISVNNNVPNYWRTLHSVESKQGAIMYRPRNRSKSCSRTKGPCGHHQLTVRALRDIGCKGARCKKDRENYSKSLQMSKKLLRLNEKRLQMEGLDNLPEYQKYLIHQQGAAGISAIITASLGNRHLSRKIARNMANNSPYSYKSLKKMGSKRAAKVFLSFWKSRWEHEKRLVSLGHKQKNKNYLFSQYEVQYVLNEILGNEKLYQ